MKTVFAVLGIILFLLAGTNSATAEKRVAFVVGNSAYQNALPLTNPRNDAIAMSAKLQELGFETVDGLDLTADEFRQKIREFARLAADSDLAIFYYAGHGLAVNGTNYLAPVDAKFEDITALDFEAVSVDFITRQMEYSGGVNLLFLDACRNNPLASTLARSLGKLSRSASVSTGLAEMKIENPGKGLAIAFATSPGEVAYDGEGEHSPFTSALLNHIGTANTDITEVMSKVTGEVYRKTDQAQRPWLNTSLTGSVVLNAVAKSPATTDPVAEAETSAPKTPSTKGDTLEVEKVVFQMARDSDRIEDYEAYLESYPNGVFEKFATRSIERLKRETTVDTGVAQQNAAAPTVGEQAAQLPTFSFNTAAAAPQTRTLGTDGTAGSFQLTPEQRAMPSNAATEQVLNMDWAKRREVQARLNLAGHNVGTPDGAIGPKTRAGLQGWQVKNGFLPTGYLNQPQYLFLVSATQQMYTVWVANNPAPVRRARTSTTRRSSQSRQNNGISPGVGAFLGGVATGLIIGKR